MMRSDTCSVVVLVTLLVLDQSSLSLGECQPDGAVQLKPKFVQPTVDPLELIPGQSTSLVCEVRRHVDRENQPRQDLRIWWCNSTYPACWQEQQSFNTRDHIYLSKTESQADNASYLRSEFNLTNVQSSQADRYYCVAFSQDQTSSNCPGSVGVDVRVRDKSVPSITDHSSSVDVLVGDPFNLTCRAEGYPTPRFQWAKNSQSISGGETGTFMKHSADTSDSGTYRCTATNDYGSSPHSSGIQVQVDKKQQNGMSTAALAALIALAVLLSILLVIITITLSRMRSNTTCFTVHKTNITGNNNKTFHANTVNVYNGTSGHRLSRGDSSHERRTFLHMHDVFIHNHSSNNQLACMIRSKLQDRESHLKVGLWSEVERPDRSSSYNKLLRLRLVNCTRIVIVVSENYLKYDYHALTSALAKSRAKPESLKGKVIIVRVLEENRIPKDLTEGIMSSLEYNVETDSCYFWPKFLKVAIPDQKDILYWV